LELPLIINELLEPLNLTIETCDSDALIEALSRASFDAYLSFIYAFEVLLKQMGTLMISFMPKLTKVLIKGVLSLSKLFQRHLKAAKQEDAEMESDNESEKTEDQGQEVYKNANRQVKSCLRKGLGLIKDIFKKFHLYHEFMEEFSLMVYQEIVADQLPLLRSCHVSEKSQLLELLCQTWPEYMNTLKNYERFPDVLPALIEMLSHPSISP